MEWAGARQRLREPVWRRTLMIEAARWRQTDALGVLAGKAIIDNDSIAETEQHLIDDLYRRVIEDGGVRPGNTDFVGLPEGEPE